MGDWTWCDRPAGGNTETVRLEPREQYSDVFRPAAELRKRRVPSEAAQVSGNTMSEWWNSMSAYVGTRRSRLHAEIVDYCKANELTQDHLRARRAAQAYIEGAVHEIWPEAEVHLCGSTAMGLALPFSDIDLVVVLRPDTAGYGSGPLPDTGPFVSELWAKLNQRKWQSAFRELNQIPHAKVPVLKAVLASGLACDISFDWFTNRSGRGVQVVRSFMRQYDTLQPLCMVLKSFLKRQNLNEVFTGGIGSFCLTVMVVSHLQNLEDKGAYKDLGALLVSFFTRYSKMHRYDRDVVSTTPGHHLSKQARGWLNINHPGHLAVESPLDPSMDIGSASYNIQEVRVKFLQARRVLLRHWHEEKLLDRIFQLHT